MLGGTLAPEHVDTYAAYLRAAVTAYRDRGLSFDAITLQNEPAYQPSDYPGMLLSAEQEAALAVAVDAQLRSAGADTSIVVHDHNWDIAARAGAVLANPTSAAVIDGVAFHCYRGDPTAQSSVRNAFPSVSVYFTECSGTRSSGTFESNLLWNARVLLVGAVRNWARTVMLWNLALDESSGPRVGGCSDCRGVVTINSVTGAVTRNEEYYALAQFGRGVDPGAVRIASTGAPGVLSNVAFRNPDGSRTLFVVNSSTSAVPTTVRDASREFTYGVPARSVITFRWGPPAT